MPQNSKNPHGDFFRSSMSHPEVARDFIKAHIPAELAQSIQWDTLKFIKKSFIREKFQHVHSDVVYQCKLDNKPIYLYCLLDSHSSPDFLMPFRLLQYKLDLMEYHINQGDKYLPIVINTCMTMGKTPYTYSTDIYDRFRDSILAKTYAELDML